MAITEESPLPFAILSKAFNFATPDEAKWWQSTGPMFAAVVANAGYDLHIQYQFLCLHRELVIPALGPYPRPSNGNDGNGNRRWKSVLTRFGLPFELSVNYTKSIARFAFEPIGPHTGTAKDPFNTKMIWEVLERFGKIVPDLDLELIRHFVRELVVSDKEAEVITSQMEYTSVYRTQNKLAVDLNHDGSILLKTYIYPESKSFVTGRSRQQLIFDAIRAAGSYQQRVEASLSTLEEFLNGSPPSTRSSSGGTAAATGHSSLEACFLSCDLIARQHSRIKIYFLETQLDYASLSDIWTVGGRRHDPETMKGLALLEMLWTTLPSAKGQCSLANSMSELGTSPPERLPFIINFCLHPGDPIPEPQIYFPGFGQNDRALADGLTAFFDRVGMSEVAESYGSQLQSYYPNQALDRSNHIQAWISYSSKKNKPYMSVYLHTFETMGHSVDWPRVWGQGDGDQIPA
ncbi:aromatic prenyltransferase [Aspergillus carlsbadensis]|nr:aromatic prenyltransferase [Aspergillus carlsbadensis]